MKTTTNKILRIFAMMALAKKAEKSLTFPVKDELFDAAFKALMADLAVPDPQSSSPLVVTYTRLGVNTGTIYNPLVALLGSPTTANSWEEAYTAEKAKGTTNETLTLQKKTIKKNALKLIRAERIILKELEKVNPGTLTAQDKKVWYIAEPNPITPVMDLMRTAHPVPNLSIHETKSLQHTLDAVNPESPKSKSLPAGIQFIWLKRFIGATAPTDPDLYSHVMFSGRFRCVSNFGMTYKRQPVWYIACYISTTGVVGNFCDPLNGTVN
ncbi:MAG: hypothetical protein ABR968_07185 [Bacteroidales bacterium]|jgi:hypothetical protein